jgi:hypothetical protein
MPPQQRKELLLEGPDPMMFHLPRNVPRDAGNVRVAHRKRPIARLPREAALIGKRLVNPLGRVGLDVPQCRGDAGFPAERTEQVYVVRHPAGRDQSAPMAADDPADVLNNRGIISLANNGARFFVLKTQWTCSDANDWGMK